jgi:hypothetical protein
MPKGSSPATPRSPDLSNIKAESEAAFALEVARDSALALAVERFGRQLVFLIWRQGYCKGQMVMIDKTLELHDVL